MADFETSDPSFEDAFRQQFDIVARYADSLGAHTHTETGEDVAQVAMLRMANQGDAINFAAAGPWLSIVAKRIVIDNHRRAQNRYEAPSDALEHEPAGVDLIDAVHRSIIVEQALSSMSNAQRKAVELTYFEGYTFRDAAEELSVPSGTVRSRVFYGIAAARTAFNNMGLNAEDVLG
jgi:RNA polymerase sigma-70 factor (ECF subfamily)